MLLPCRSLESEGRSKLRPYQRIHLYHYCHAVAFAAPTRASTIERKITRPSAESSADSTARSGCGIRPATFLSRLQIPAIFAVEPLGFPAASSEPSALVYRKTTCWCFSNSVSVESSQV